MDIRVFSVFLVTFHLTISLPEGTEKVILDFCNLLNHKNKIELKLHQDTYFLKISNNNLFAASPPSSLHPPQPGMAPRACVSHRCRPRTFSAVFCHDLFDS